MSTTANATPNIRIAKKTYRKNIARQISRWLGYIIAAIVTLYLCFAATLLRVLPANNSIGPILIKNATFPADQAPAGKIVLANTESVQGKDSLSHLREAFVPSKDVVKVRIVAGPFGSVSFNSKQKTVTVDGQTFKMEVLNPPSEKYLDHQYLVQCLDGACTKGAGLIIAESNFYGEPLLKN